MKKFSWVVIVIVVVFAVGCKEDKFEPSSEAKCKIGRWIYTKVGGADVSYGIKYKLNSFTELDLVTDEILIGETWSIQKTYKHIYRNDSLIVKDFVQFQEKATLFTALIVQKATELTTTEVKRFIDGNIYRYRFDTSKDKQITVTLEKLDGDIATYDSRGVYYFDNNGDVVRQEIFRSQAIHGDEPGFVAYQDRAFTYDIVINPLRYLVVPQFTTVVLPDVAYFSSHNRLTETYNSSTLTYKFVYGTDPMPSSVTTPDGTVQKFEYPNCTN